jgi:predicted Fe-Mo cluster-binding NifX family protein
MKVVVTSKGEGLQSEVDPRFGRAASFVLYDTDTRDAKTVANSKGAGSAHGAGTQAAATISQLGAECLVTGACGPKAFDALTRAGITVYTGAEGTVADAIEAFSNGRLTAATSGEASQTA